MGDGSLRKELILKSGDKATRICVQSLSLYKHNDDLHKMADRKSTRLNSSHVKRSRMPSSA